MPSFKEKFGKLRDTAVLMEQHLRSMERWNCFWHRRESVSQKSCYTPGTAK